MPNLTKEQIAARRKAAREWKRRNKSRRTKNGYSDEPKPKQQVRRGRYSLPEKFWLSLKEKHKQYEGTRLEKSIKPPEFLEL